MSRHRASLLPADRYSLLSSTLRNSNVSRHRPPRALYGPGRSEMVACLSGSLGAAAKAADLVSRRSPAKSRAAKKMHRRFQVFSGSFRRTKRRRCPPPCQGSSSRWRYTRLYAASAHLARTTVNRGGACDRGCCCAARWRDATWPYLPRDPARRRRSAATRMRAKSEWADWSPPLARAALMSTWRGSCWRHVGI